MARNPQVTRWKDLKTGLLFLVGVAILGWLGFTISKNTGLFSTSHPVHFFTQNASGLRNGNFVGIAGKKVGTVSSIEFVRRGDSNIIDVQMKIEDQYFPLINSDAYVLVKGMGILGDKEVDIILGHHHDHVADSTTLALGTEAGLEDLTANAIHTMQNVDSLTSKIMHGEGTLGRLITTTELNDKINQTLANLSDVEHRLSAGDGLVPQLLNDKGLAQQVSSTSKDLSELMNRLKEGNGSLGKFLMGDAFLTKLNQVSDHTDSLLRQLGNPNGSLARISNDPGLYNNLNESVVSAHRAIGSLDSLLTDFKANPKRYIHVSVF